MNANSDTSISSNILSDYDTEDEDVSDEDMLDDDGTGGDGSDFAVLRLQELLVQHNNTLSTLVRQRVFEIGSRAPKSHHKRIDWGDHVAKTVGNDTFQTRYHVTHPTFEKLVEILGISVNELQSTRSTSGKVPISPNHIVAGALRYLGGSKTVDVADIVGVSDPSVHRLLDLFLDEVIACEALQIKLPTGDDLRKVMNG
jgi:hypothetical protein